MNKPKKKILAISGSTRKNSSNEVIINLIDKLSSDDFDIQLYTGVTHKVRNKNIFYTNIRF